MKYLISSIFLVAMLLMPVSVGAQTTPIVTPQDARIQTMTQIIVLLQEIIQLLQAQLALRNKPIDANTIVYLTCDYEPKATPGKNLITVCGTGTIVNPKGYILTSRHLVDPAWTVANYPQDPSVSYYQTLVQGYNLTKCVVSPPSANRLPTPEEIKTINPTVIVGPEKYTASVKFIPTNQGMSPLEYGRLDFGILQIDHAIDCGTSNCPLPATFPYTPIATITPSGTPEVLSYGYPLEISPNLRNGLKGSTGNLVKYYGGDGQFTNKPFLFEWSASDSRKGRSGSPIFVGGKTIGIEIGSDADNTVINYGLAMPAINEILSAGGAGTIFVP